MLPIDQIDFVVRWVLQETAGAARHLCFYDNYDPPLVHRRFQERYVMWLAHWIGVSSQSAADSLTAFRELNRRKLTQLVDFLALPDNQFHCFVF